MQRPARRRAAAVAALATLAALPAARAQVPPSPGDSVVTALPGARFADGGLHRLLLGDTWRVLWHTPVTAPVLDLERFAGGLTAFERGGSAQTRSLRLRAPDGRTFVFRALEKDPTQTWPPLLRRSPARSFADDQISAIFPAGALVVSALAEAAGLLHAEPILVVLPDHPRLGEWRDEFRGNMGFLEQRLRGRGADVADALGASRVVNSERLVSELRSNPAHRIDDRAYLTARLFDMLVGDWDRHADQWSWAAFDEPDGVRWAPVPRDRDWALSRLDGLFYGVLRWYLPQYQSFGPTYGRVYGLTLSGEPLDRRLLGWLHRPAWDSAVSALETALDDATIRAAVDRVPAEVPEAVRADLASTLARRRDGLRQAAERFYRQLARVVDLRGTGAADTARIDTDPDGGVTLSLDTGGHAPFRRRRFDPGETHEIRLHLDDGDDTVIANGGPPSIRLRVVGGGGTDRIDAPASRLTVYDDSSTLRAPGVALRQRPYTPPPPPREGRLLQPRDWGSAWTFVPWLEARPEVGVLTGGGATLTRYGFRKHPFASRLHVRAGHATARGVNADVTADVRFERPDLRLLARAAALDLSVVRYFGFGNATLDAGDDRHDVPERSWLLESALEWAFQRRATLRLGAFLHDITTGLDQPSLLGIERPYGSGRFTEAGIEARAAFDSRDLPVWPTRGVHLAATLRAVPAVFDAAAGFGSVRLDVSTYLTPRGVPATLAVRAGGMRAFGRYPFFEAAALGGRQSLRGFPSRRFIGDGSAWVGAEARTDLGGFTVVVPGEWGLHALGDVGRVFYQDDASRRWHTGWGGGLWFAMLDRRSTITVTAAHGESRPRVYVQAGFHF